LRYNVKQTSRLNHKKSVENEGFVF
jgi:hypothetical protein